MNFIRLILKSYLTLLNRRRFKIAVNKRPVKIVIGAGGIYDDGWIPTEMDVLNLLKPDDWSKVLSNSSIDLILAEHVWEHLTLSEGIIAAETCYKFLKPGGNLRVAVPDGLNPENEYIQYVKPGGTGPGSDDHKVLYTYITFKKLFEQVGFKVSLLEYFDENGQFVFNDWTTEYGKIIRSKRYDDRNSEKVIKYNSIIIDATK